MLVVLMLEVRERYIEAGLVSGSLRLVHGGDIVALFSDGYKSAAEVGIVAAEGREDGPERLDEGIHAQIVTFFRCVRSN